MVMVRWRRDCFAGGVRVVVGAMLPTAHHVSRKARFRVSPEILYAVLAGPPDWRKGIKSFALLPEQDGRKRWWEEDGHGEKVTYELVEANPPVRLAVRIADQGLPYGGTWTFDVTPVAGGGAELSIREDGEVHNIIFRFMARFVFDHTASIEGYLRDLGAKFGESVTIEHVTMES
jgi:uncharacterized protein YndB with AHSA1/START domain